MRKDVKVPVGRAGRLLRIARAGARTATALVSSSASEAALLRAAESLGTLRSLAAKVGQMAGYIDGFVPETHRAAFQKAMAPLQAGATTSPATEIRATVEAELGAPIPLLFAEWDDMPFASASIGQVHRARLIDGRDVAVKVQHPGIEKALRSDLSNAAAIGSFVDLFAPPALNAREIFEQVKGLILDEIDYTREAERQRFFAAFHRGDPKIRIPQVIDELSSRRVLTSELVEGLTLDRAADASIECRRSYCETLWRFVFKSMLVAGKFNGDPHPGNYLFQPDGRVTFLDFGLVQTLPPDLLELVRDAHRAALRRDDAAFGAAVRALFATRGGRYEVLVEGFSRRAFEPLFASPFRITKSYVSEVVRSIYALKKQMLSRDGDFTGFPAEAIFLNRLQFGFLSVLARFDVVVDYAAVEVAFLKEAGPPTA
jgi:predicted unusual protein kinase regulating ubiquinone biosynthesis (AarF/ABC1/UbiB family)